MQPHRRPLYVHVLVLAILSALLLVGSVRLAHANRIAHLDLDLTIAAPLAAFAFYSLVSLQGDIRRTAARDGESIASTGALRVIVLHTVVALAIAAGAGAFLAVIVIASTASGHANFVKLLLRPVTAHCFVIAACFAAMLWIRAMNALRDRCVWAWWHPGAEADAIVLPTHNLDGSPWVAHEEEFYRQALGNEGA
jgi:hypothetical protein